MMKRLSIENSTRRIRNETERLLAAKLGVPKFMIRLAGADGLRGSAGTASPRYRND